MQDQKNGNFQPDIALLSSLVQSLPLNIYAKDTGGTFIFANSFYCKAVGKERNEIIGKNDFEVHPEKLAHKYRADDERIMTSRQTESIEEEWQSIDGEHGYSQVLKTPLYDNRESDEVVGTIGIFWDVTRRKKAEIELAEERNLLRTLIDNLPDAIYVKDLESRFLLGNKSVAELMGVKDPQELVGKSDFDFYPEKIAKSFRHDELAVLQEGIALTDIEEKSHDAQGQDRWSLTTKLPLRSIDGATIGLIGMGHDITQRKKKEIERKDLEAQLLHSQKMETVGTLTAGIAHDFNNLLSIINGYTELLTVGMEEDDQQYETLRKILDAGQSAAELVSQLMTFSRKQVIQPQLIDFNDLLHRVQQMLRRLLGEKIDFQLSLDSDLWFITIDPTQMEQVIVNLAANARDAMPDGGILRLETENVLVTQAEVGGSLEIANGEYIKFTVTDNGCGIKKELQHRIFEPFFTTKDKSKGTGLGLATIFGIVQQNKGTIKLQSEENVGTSFEVYLPRTSRKDLELELELSVDDLSLPVGSEYVLVVEDEKDVRNLVTDILERQGYSVQDASNGIAALMLAAAPSEQKIELLITDIVMPGMSGKELSEKIISYFPDIKILFMSGYANDEISQYCLAQPGIAFIPKPFSPSAIAQKVRNLLDS